MKRMRTLLCVTALILTSCSGGGKASVADVIRDSEITGEITVSCYNTARYQGFLNEAARGFELRFPGTKVNIECFGKLPEQKEQRTVELDDGPSLSFDFGFDPAAENDARNDYRYRVNTELMSGRGADVYVLDVLPIHVYQAGGVLDNLREYMDNDADFDITQYRENLFDALTGDAGQFVMPIGYSFDFLTYNKSLFTDQESEAVLKLDAYSNGELIDLAKEAFDRQVNSGSHTYMFKGDGKDMFWTLFAQDYEKFIDSKNRKANFTDGQFIALLDKIREYTDAGYIKNYEKKPNGWEEIQALQDAPLDAIEEWYNSRYENNEDYFFSEHDSALLLYKYEAPLFEGWLQAIGEESLENGELAGTRVSDTGEKYFWYEAAFGINSNSENKKTAWEFIKFLLSYYVQTSYYNFAGHPINRNALAEKTKFLIRPDGKLTSDERQILDAYTAQMDKYTERIDAYLFSDPTVYEFVTAEIDAYFNGEKTAEEAARILQGKLNLYLSE